MAKSSEESNNDEDEQLYSFLKHMDKESYSSYELDNYSGDFDSPSENSSSYEAISKCPLYDNPGLNKTFNDTRLRDIERDNSILMTKILSKSRRPKQYKIYQQPQIKSSFDINRRKAQAKIEYENKILLKKIQGAKPVVRK
ncbi:hypothetical protein HHI36_007343 [Cryptolaemus montrouzieri]|uniref:Uncharacterized protein n=1 Tax=Cryptolaemus montrouzieri TaxID=559131 RepID=A0ABD2MPR0_9CUCU